MMAGPIVGDAASPRAGVPISLSVLKDQRHYGNAALDISSRSTAPGRPPPSRLRCGDLPAPPKLGVVDLIAPHNMQPDQERSGDRHLGPRCPAPMLDPPVEPLEVGVHPKRRLPGLTEHVTQHPIAVLRDATQAVFAGRRRDGRRQAMSLTTCLL